jgi:hypothetical protein|tara:strand:- start:51 stop:575 length:525 start_codon:yes stop_codon:yes gene_type:complete
MSKNKNTDTIKITPTIKGKPLKSRPFSKSRSAGPMQKRDYKFDKKKKGGMSDKDKKVIPLMPTGIIYKGKAKDYPGIKKIIKDKNKKAEGGMMLKNPKKADLDKDGKLSSYEKKRGMAIEKNMKPSKKMGGGMMKYSKGGEMKRGYGAARTSGMGLQDEKLVPGKSMDYYKDLM